MKLFVGYILLNTDKTVQDPTLIFKTLQKGLLVVQAMIRITKVDSKKL